MSLFISPPSRQKSSLTRSDRLGEKFYNTALVLRFASRHCEQTRIAGRPNELWNLHNLRECDG